MNTARPSSAGQRFLAGFQRLHVGDQQFVGHDRAGAEHLGAADGDAGGILVDNAGNQVSVGRSASNWVTGLI